MSAVVDAVVAGSIIVFATSVWFAAQLETTVPGEPTPRAIARGRRRAKIEFARTRGGRP